MEKGPVILHIDMMLNHLDEGAIRAVYMIVKKLYDLSQSILSNTKNTQIQSFFTTGGFQMKEELLEIIEGLNGDDLRLLYIVALELKKEK